jgi:hypothetical protein
MVMNIEKEKDTFHNERLVLIPHILDPKKDRKIYDIYYNINILYMDLIQDFVLTEDIINIFIEDYKTFINRLTIECKDAKIRLLLLIESSNIFEDLKWFCIHNEFYEGAANLKMFEDGI